MAPAGSTNWTAQVGAAIATLHVIPLLERDLPGQEFILGGLQAIAFYAQALNERRRHDISAALPQRALPTNELPIIVHMQPVPGTVDRVPSSFSTNPTRSSPFQTTDFLHVHAGVEYLAQIKFSSRLGAPDVEDSALVGTVRTPVRKYLYLRPAAVVVEQLMLAASGAASHPDQEAHAICASLRAIRYAWNVLHVSATTARHMTSVPGGPHLQQNYAKKEMFHALVDMLFPNIDDDDRPLPHSAPPVVPAGHQSLADWWLEKLRPRGADDIVHRVVTWEHASPVGNDEQRWPTLGGEYSRLRDDLVSVLLELLVASPHSTHGAHDALQRALAMPSLAKSSASAFEPTGREQGETRTVFS